MKTVNTFLKSITLFFANRVRHTHNIKYVLAIVALFLIQIIFINSCKADNRIANYTDYKVEGEIEHVCKLFSLDSVGIMIRYMSFMFDRPDYKNLTAYVIPNGNNNYTIFLKKDMDENIKTVITHEMIHVFQFYSMKLEWISFTEMKYNGKLINCQKVRYENRPWEREAFILTERINELACLK